MGFFFVLEKTRILKKSVSVKLVAVILFFFTLQVLGVIFSKSATSDEYSHHIASGYSYVVKRDFRMNSAMPPLPKILSGLPLWAAGFKADFSDPVWQSSDTPGFAKKFFHEWNPGKIDLITTLARLPILIVGLLFGFFVYRVAKVWVGEKAALFSLVFFAFCPDIVAHTALATSDLTISFFFFCSIASFASYLNEPSPKPAIICALFTALTFLSKQTAVLLPVIYFLIASFSRQMRVIHFKYFFIFAVRVF